MRKNSGRELQGELKSSPALADSAAGRAVEAPFVEDAEEENDGT